MFAQPQIINHDADMQERKTQYLDFIDDEVCLKS